MPTTPGQRRARRSIRSDDPNSGTRPGDARPSDDTARHLSRLRAMARKQGLRIHRKRTVGQSVGPTYDLVDGDAVVATVTSLEDLQGVLSRLAEEGPQQAAQLAEEGPQQAVQLAEETRSESTRIEPTPAASPRTGQSRQACPRCGAVRTGSFRFCRSCGMDFEPAHPSQTGSLVLPFAPQGSARLGGLARTTGKTAANIAPGAIVDPGRSDPSDGARTTGPTSAAGRDPRLRLVVLVVAVVIMAVVVGVIPPLVMSLLGR